MKKPVMIVVAVLVLIIGVFLITSRSAKNPKLATKVQVPAENIITYTDNGFEPSNLTTKSGTTIEIKNNGTNVGQFDSNPHPDHTDNIELNVGPISPGKSATFVVSKTGTFGYHNHLNTKNVGIIIVE